MALVFMVLAFMVVGSMDVRGIASQTTGTPISSTATPTSAPSPV